MSTTEESYVGSNVTKVYVQDGFGYGFLTSMYEIRCDNGVIGGFWIKKNGLKYSFPTGAYPVLPRNYGDKLIPSITLLPNDLDSLFEAINHNAGNLSLPDGIDVMAPSSNG